MKSIVLVAVALLAVAAAAPSEQVKTPEIIFSEFVQQPDGSYSYKFQTDDGTGREETGIVREALDEENKLQRVVVVSGSYTFIDTNGKTETIKYAADETGYHAEGDSIPKNVSRR